MQIKKILLLLCLGLQIGFVQAQVLDSKTKIEIGLSNGVEVQLYGSINMPKAYYYLPTNLAVSMRDSIPEFSFLAYDQDEDGTNDGAIMHLLLNWGLNYEQQLEAEKLLHRFADSTLVLFGNAPVSPAKGQAWRILSPEHPKLANLLNETIQASANIPSHAGGKWAASFKFDATQLKQIEELLQSEEQLKQVYFEFELTCQLTQQDGYTTRSKESHIILSKNLYELISLFTLQ